MKIGSLYYYFKELNKYACKRLIFEFLRICFYMQRKGFELQFIGMITSDRLRLLLDFKTHSYLGVNLTDGNQYHFQNATMFQKDATAALKTNNTEDYISFLQDAYDEFLAIHL